LAALKFDNLTSKYLALFPVYILGVDNFRMSYGKRFLRFCNDNVVMIAGISIIVGFHWAWLKLQNVPSLVDPSQKTDLPIFTGAKRLKELAESKYHELTAKEPKE
jgi:hypothetical protein